MGHCLYKLRKRYGEGSDLSACERGPNFLGNVVGFDVFLCSPALEVSSLTVIAIICKPEFRSDQVYEFIIDDDSTVIINGHMSHRPTVNSSLRGRKDIPISRRIS